MALCGAIWIMGCGAGPAAGWHAGLRLIPELGPASRALQAIVAPYTRGDVASLVIRLFLRDGTTETEVAARTLTTTEFDQPIAFASLRPFRTYRARGFAFQADGALISAEELSYVDITVGNDDAPTVGTLPIRLQDKTFDGRATSAPIAVTDGTLVPAGIETIGQLRPWSPGHGW